MESQRTLDDRLIERLEHDGGDAPADTDGQPIDHRCHAVAGTRPAPSGPPPDAARLRARISGVRVKDVNGTYSGAVMDVGSGATLFTHDGDRGLLPASTLKLLTAGAALSTLGPDHTIRTTVVSPRSGEIVLVGGGDPYLAGKPVRGEFPRRASVTDLARQTAAALAKRKIRTVRLGYDASLFAGPAWTRPGPARTGTRSPRYRRCGSTRDGHQGDGRRTRRANGDRFAAALKRNGVRVRDLHPTKAPSSAVVVAAVSSPPLARLVEKMLMASDNDAAEVLSRQVAVAGGRPGSTVEAVSAVRAELTRLGVWTDGTRIVDGSGLARQNRLPAAPWSGCCDCRPTTTGQAAGGGDRAAGGRRRGHAPAAVRRRRQPRRPRRRTGQDRHPA